MNRFTVEQVKGMPNYGTNRIGAIIILRNLWGYDVAIYGEGVKEKFNDADSTQAVAYANSLLEGKE